MLRCPILWGLLSLSLAVGADPDVADLHRLAQQMDRPRLLLPADLGPLRERLASDPLLAQARDRLLRTAEAMRDQPVLQRVKKGRRMLGSSRLALRRILHAALAFRLTGEDEHAALAKRDMLAAAAFRDWNPEHFLDVAEMCAALAIGYDWLYDELDEDERDRIATALIDKGLRAVPRNDWWLETTNNWNQVCHGGLTLAALAVWEREPDLAAATVQRAIRRIPHSMVEYGPDGAYPEGPTYWRYGTAYNVLFLEALQSAFGTEFEMADMNGFMHSADFYLHSTGASGSFFNYGDTNIGKSSRPSSTMYWFADRLDRPELLWRERQLLAQKMAEPIDAESNDFRFFPLILLRAPPLTGISAPGATDFTAAGLTPVSLMRTSWTDPAAAFVGIKGGSPGHNHAHMDSGSFVYDRYGLRWSMDLGKVSYGAVEGHGINIWNRDQDGGRWRLFRHVNQAHSTLVIDDRLQRVAGSAPIVSHAYADGAGHTVIDLGPVYADCLRQARRGVALRPSGALVIQDELEADTADREVRWGMLTPAEVDVLEPRRARLVQGDKALVAVIQEPATAQWQVIDTSQPLLPFEPANPGTRMLAFHHPVAAGSRTRLIVHLVSPDESSGMPDVIPLQEWTDAQADPWADR